MMETKTRRGPVFRMLRFGGFAGLVLLAIAVGVAAAAERSNPVSSAKVPSAPAPASPSPGPIPQNPAPASAPSQPEPIRSNPAPGAPEPKPAPIAPAPAPTAPPPATPRTNPPAPAPAPAAGEPLPADTIGAAKKYDAALIVKKLEELMRGDANYSEMKMTIHNPEWPAPRGFEMKAWEDTVNQKSFIRITAPARDRGRAFLKEGNVFKVYIPSERENKPTHPPGLLRRERRHRPGNDPRQRQAVRKPPAPQPLGDEDPGRR